jgi:hypothetical protein
MEFFSVRATQRPGFDEKEFTMLEQGGYLQRDFKAFQLVRVDECNKFRGPFAGEHSVRLDQLMDHWRVYTQELANAARYKLRVAQY